MYTSYVEIIGALTSLSILVFILFKGKAFKKGLNFILIGFGLIFLGQLISITGYFFDHSEKLFFLTFSDLFGIVGETACFTAGIIFLLLGIIRLMSIMKRNLILEEELKNTNENLESTIKKKTIDLELTLIEADQFFSHLSSQNEALNASAIVSRVSPDGEITYVNELFCKITQYSLSELIGQDHKILNSDYHPAEFWADLWSTITNDKRWRGEIRNKAKDGSYFWVDTVIVPIKNDKGRTMEYLAIRFDITERKKAEKELAKAKNDAEDATKAKSEFLARMSHEIRTPMNAIIGLSQLALKTNLSAQQKDYITKVNSSGKALLGIINDILDFSKIEAGKLELESIEFDLEKVLQDVENVLGIKAYEKDLELAVAIAPDVPLSLIGDPLRLGQILINLVSNAIKFTNKGEVVIRTVVENIKEDKITLRFNISDTGIGIEKYKLDELFISFSQADNSTTRKYGGTGLGLAISQKLAKSMHGDIAVESEIGKGSTFAFTAQFGICVNQRRDQLVFPDDLRGINVFICDDNKSALAVIAEMLKALSCNVQTFNTGYNLLKALESGASCQVVFIDWKMADWNWIKTAEEIQKSTKINTLPQIIITTTHNNETMIEVVNQFGISSVLFKPTNYTSLFNTILKVLGRSELISNTLYHDDFQSLSVLKQLSGACILLVEDNEVNQQVAREIIESAGCIVELAEDGLQAVQKTKDQPQKYELVLMDIQMPVMDGYEAAAEIRKNKRLDTLPIVAITADAIVGIKEKCFKAGMNDFITKPFEPSGILNVLLKHIKYKERKAVNNLPRKILVDDIVIPEFRSINTLEGITRVNNNKNLYVKMLRSFYRNNSQFSEKIIEAYHQNDLILIKRLVHTLKGISGNVGAKDLYALCSDFHLDENTDKEQLVQKIEPIKNELINVLNEIEFFVKELDQKETPDVIDNSVKPNEQEIIKVLEVLLQQIKTSDADALDTLKQLLKIQGINNYRDIVNQIGQELNHYNFDKSYVLSTELLEKIGG